MSRVSKITLAQRQIADHFRATGRTAFSEREILKLIEEKRAAWDLPATTTADRIVQKLTEIALLKPVKLKWTDQSEHIVYTFEEPSIYEIAVALRPKSYISHYPAVFLHDLTSQIPKTIYTTVEQSFKRTLENELEQEAIDRVFAAPQRRSGLMTEYDDYIIMLITAKFSNRSGVLLSTRHNNAFSMTNLERTLMDITVRPNYAGGAFAVLDAYRHAVKENRISSNKLLALLEAMDFTYPYHQAIGFYLERAGYEGKLIEKLKVIPMKYKFYLDYGMTSKTYDSNWKIWHPTTM